MLLPRHDPFLYMYVRKDAVLSSQIEGTQSTLTDLLRYETTAEAGQPFDDVREVSNYVDAMMFGLDRLEELPLSLRLIREMHGRLMDGNGRIVKLFKTDRDRIMADSDRAGSSLRVHEWMQSNPFVSSNRLVERIGLSSPTVNAALADLECLGLIPACAWRV